MAELDLSCCALLPQQLKAMQAIMDCRTPALGGYVEACDACDYRRVVYSPCRNRHCPSCQGLLAQEWTSELQARLLPVRHLHVVFTLPQELRALAFQNMDVVYDLMLRAAGAVLRHVAKDQKHLGAQIGATALLHTWTRDLRYHPHVHCVVTAGGLTAQDEWVQAWSDQYFASQKLLASLYRVHVMRGVRRAWNAGELRFAGRAGNLADPDAFHSLCETLFEKDWLVYAKSAFKDLDRLIHYFGRYVHRIAISDSRLLEVTEDCVTFATKGGATESLSPLDFAQRFLLHVLPHGFVKVRHYGLYAPACAKRLEAARRALKGDAPAEDPTSAEDRDSDSEPPKDVPCPQCLFGVLVREEFPPLVPGPLPHT